MPIIRRNPNVMWREEEETQAQATEGLQRGEDVAQLGTSVLFSGGTMLSLNLLGTEIWQSCEGKSIAELVAELLLQFDVEEEELRADVAGFLDELYQKGFLSYEE